MMVQECIDIISGLAIIIASLVAIIGIFSWRVETKWKRKYELAENVLSLFYQAKESISRIRSILTSVDEGKTRKREERELHPDILDKAYVFHERWKKEEIIFNKLKESKFKFRAIFGKESIEPFDKIDEIIKDIYKANCKLRDNYWIRRNEKMPKEVFNKHLSELQENEAMLWEGYKEKDEIVKRIERAIDEIEHICNKSLKKRY